MAEGNQKKITLAELRSWLEGVQELQGDDWTPTAEQWKKIQAKISNLREDTEVIEATHKSFDEIRNALMRIEQALQTIRFNSAGMAASGVIPQPTVAPSSVAPVLPPFVPPVSAMDNVGPTDALGRPIGGPRMTTTMPPGNTNTIKTPDSGANYSTPFA